MFEIWINRYVEEIHVVYTVKVTIVGSIPTLVIETFFFNFILYSARSIDRGNLET